MTGRADAQGRAALEAFGLADAPFRLVSHRENRVYEVTLPDGGRGALRLHRPGYHGHAALEAELALMDHLSKSGLRVPAPLAAPGGATLVHAGDPPVLADLLSWLEGEPLGRSGEPLALPLGELLRRFNALGALLARMHSATDAWHPADFPRPAWDAEGLAGEQPVWGRFWDNPRLAPDERARLTRARDRARGILAEHEALDRGPIHADPVRENVLYSAEGPALIDFDDCGTGYRMFDIVTALYPNRDEPAFSELRAALLEGYGGVRPLGEPDPRILSAFMFLRSASYVGWIVPRADLSDAGERERRFIGNALGLADVILAS